MARRSSARLRDRNSTTPKRVSLSHDAKVRTPRTVPAKLSSLQESDEMPGAFPQSASPPDHGSPVFSKRRAVGPDATPRQVTPIQPTNEEMHPKQHQQSTAKPLDEARHLGFSNMGAWTEPPKHTSRIATLQGTPTRASNPAEDVSASPTYAFTFRREHSLELSPDAKKLMNEKREEAARIRQQMASSAETLKETPEAFARKIATPKSKKGRFSGTHMAQFEKMDSIAGHASAFRAKAHGINGSSTPATSDSHAQATQHKSLKRSPSKAQLDDKSQEPQRALYRSPFKPTLVGAASCLPRAMSTNQLDHSSSPEKRFKKAVAEDVSTSRQHASEDARPLPATPERADALRMHPSNLHPSTLTTPTQASLARAANVTSAKTTMIPGPPLRRSPSKPAIVGNEEKAHEALGPLLARSPSKASLFEVAQPQGQQAIKSSSPLLCRSPSKASLFSTTQSQTGHVTSIKNALMTRSPLKASPFKKRADPSEHGGQEVAEPQLLARTPLKCTITRSVGPETQGEKVSAIPLLARSPAKMPHLTEPADAALPSPGKAGSTNLMGRFNLLRASPVKSILRTPQRLYSDDPSKVAAGTHLATPPPKYSRDDISGLKSRSPAIAPLSKHVDFSSSTKARDEAAHCGKSVTQLKNSTPSSTSDFETKPASNAAATISYPSLPDDAGSNSPSPQKRRQTTAPGDFTFRADNHRIVFGSSPMVDPGLAKLKRPSTIRHVSADACGPPAPAAGSKKRKFEFENEAAIYPELTINDKENAEEITSIDVDEQRPAKRPKVSSTPQTSPVKTAAPPSRVPTLGVKPKKGTQDGKDKRPTKISQARLNALAQPKRRV